MAPAESLVFIVVDVAVYCIDLFLAAIISIDVFPAT